MTATASIPPADSLARAPRLAHGTRLIGQVEGSGLHQPPYLLGRPDGQVVQLSRLLFLVAAGADGSRDAEGIAARVSQDLGRTLSADDVRYVLHEKLAPLGVLEGGPTPARVDPLLGLRFRFGVIPPRAVSAIGSLFSPLFAPAVVCVALAALLAVDVWLFAVHGLGASVAAVVYEPTLVLALTAAMVLTLAFHEVGHAAACRYAGARPGAMGVGIYLIMPAFYTDLTDTYRLSRADRLRADLGGVYFNALAVLAVVAAYVATGFEPLLLVAVIAQLQILDQFLPWLRLDGYYVVSDLIGVPDLFARVRPVLRSLVPGSPADPRVRELRPWARAAVTAWVLTTVPALAAALGLVVYHAPGMLAMIHDSLLSQLDELAAAAAEARPGDVLLRTIAIALLVAPALGLAVNAVWFARRGTRALAGAHRRAR